MKTRESTLGLKPGQTLLEVNKSTLVARQKWLMSYKNYKKTQVTIIFHIQNIKSFHETPLMTMCGHKICQLELLTFM